MVRARAGMHLAAICNMKRGDGSPLEQVGRYVQLRDAGLHCKNEPFFAQVTFLLSWRGLLVGNFHNFPAQYATVRNHYVVMSYVRERPVTKQLKECTLFR